MNPAVYERGRPKIAGSVMRAYALRSLPGVGLFTLLPAAGLWLALQPAGSLLVRIPGGLLFGLILFSVLRGFADDVRRKFGLRVVPRFEHRVEGTEGGAYFGGEALVWAMERLDEVAGARGLSTFAELGADGFEADADDPWFDCSQGLRTVRGVTEAQVALEPRLSEDLQQIEAALERGAAQRLRFRLVVVACTAMNSALYEQLRSKGY